jgi:hypothetical protein
MPSQRINEIFSTVKEEHPTDWLLPTELLELSKEEATSKRIQDYLNKLVEQKNQLASLIHIK